LPKKTPARRAARTGRKLSPPCGSASPSRRSAVRPGGPGRAACVRRPAHPDPSDGGNQHGLDHRGHVRRGNLLRRIDRPLPAGLQPQAPAARAAAGRVLLGSRRAEGGGDRPDAVVLHRRPHVRGPQDPLRIPACDLADGNEVVFETGPIVPAIRASISMPGLFEPFHYQGHQLVDGAMIRPIPVHLLGNDEVDFKIPVRAVRRRSRQQLHRDVHGAQKQHRLHSLLRSRENVFSVMWRRSRSSCRTSSPR